MDALEGLLVPFDQVGDLALGLLDLLDGAGPAPQGNVGEVGVGHAPLDPDLGSGLESRRCRRFLGAWHDVEPGVDHLTQWGSVALRSGMPVKKIMTSSSQAL